jgi:hypothetical protein
MLHGRVDRGFDDYCQDCEQRIPTGNLLSVIISVWYWFTPGRRHFEQIEGIDIDDMTILTSGWVDR